VQVPQVDLKPFAPSGHRMLSRAHQPPLIIVNDTLPQA
jgi:hypothetical protein